MTFKRGNTYWYKFYWSVAQPDGATCSILVRRSAKTRNQRAAREMEEEHRRALRLGEIHPDDIWPVSPAPSAPTLRDFSARFLDHSALRIKQSSLQFYRTCTARLLADKSLAQTPLTRINGENIAAYVRRRHQGGHSVSTVNADIRTIRRMLRLAYEWDVVPKAPVLHELAGGGKRERVISFEEESRYLRAAGSSLRNLAVLAVDTGLRPNSELFCLEWNCVSLQPARGAPYGLLRVAVGKTPSAARIVPLTPRAREVLGRQNARSRHSRWVFPGAGNTGHLVTIQASHRKATIAAGLQPFAFYSWRHTFGTRCAESGMDRFTVAKLMGHSSPQISERYYIHITEAHVALGVEKLIAYQAARLDADPSAARS